MGRGGSNDTETLPTRVRRRSEKVGCSRRAFGPRALNLSHSQIALIRPEPKCPVTSLLSICYDCSAAWISLFRQLSVSSRALTAGNARPSIDL